MATPGGRQALTRKFDTVRLVESDKPGVTVSGKMLVVGFAPGAGAAGRASSREVALQLGKMLQIRAADRCQARRRWKVPSNSGAISNFENSNPGATVQPTSV